MYDVMGVSSSSTFVKLGTISSACLDIACGVLQGSVLPKIILKLYKDIYGFYRYYRSKFPAVTSDERITGNRY